MSFKGWDTIEIETENGKQNAVAPIIISASRSTDIPAFYSDWFMERLNAGYSKWINPFNNKPQYISFSKTRLIVFWTKNPKPMMNHLSKLEQRGINYYFTYTLNDYDQERLEPGLPSLEERVPAFADLSDRLGKERVVWRFDPLILSAELTPERLLERIEHVGNQIHQYTTKLVISFADILVYKKVKRNLNTARFNFKNFDDRSISEIANGLREVNKKWNLDIASCAETVELSQFGINHNKCIDDGLMKRVFSHDKTLMDFLGFRGEPLSLFETVDTRTDPLKDKGQRKSCGCIVSKDIGQYNTCHHLCAYCYANYSQKVVEKNFRSHCVKGESIISV